MGVWGEMGGWGNGWVGGEWVGIGCVAEVWIRATNTKIQTLKTENPQVAKLRHVQTSINDAEKS